MKQPSVVGGETACWAHAYCLARPSNPIHGAVSRSVLCSWVALGCVLVLGSCCRGWG